MAKDTALVAALKPLLEHSYTMYYRAHSAHWNITGSSFVSLHGFFSDIYEDVFGAIDRLAESIRQHSEMVPVNLKDILSYGADQKDATTGGDSTELLKELRVLNTKMMTHLAYVRPIAEAAGDFGLANFIQDREAVHLKLDWQLNALLTSAPQ